MSSITAPLWWIETVPGSESRLLRNGSAFFLDAGAGVFCVTAAHVVAGLQRARETGVVQAQLGDTPEIDLREGDRLIDIDYEVDLATLRVTDDEVRRLQKVKLTGQQRIWPPAPPTKDAGVLFAGFPETEQRWVGHREISLAIVAMGNVASGVNDRDISSLIERERLIDVIGRGVPRTNYDYSGMSGGPMLTVVESAGVRSWRLAGVVYSGPNVSNDPDQSIEGFELIRARRADFLAPDGTIDRSTWR